MIHTQPIGLKKKTVGLKKPKIKENHIAIVLDNSGSMFRIQEPIRRLYNEQIQAHINSANIKDSGTTYVSLILFGERVTVVFEHQPVSQLAPLEYGEYSPNEGATALYDGIGTAIELLSKYEGEGDKSFLVQTLTDGAHNRNILFNQKSIQLLTKSKEATDRWTFVTMGANQDVTKTVEGFGGTQFANTMNFMPTKESVNSLSGSLSAGTKSYYNARACGQSMSKSFFEPEPVDTTPINP